MQKQLLHTGWTMNRVGAPESEKIPATVPGSVYGDLLAAGRIDDPFWRDNEMRILPLSENDYVYRLRFDAMPEILSSQRVVLHCGGLDTIADVYLNGEGLFRADNMHRVWEFDVTDCIKPQDNLLEITFLSPTKYIKEQQAIDFAGGTEDAMEGFPHIRKAHCMFGWDWGPRLPDAGIWRDIYLQGVDSARIDRVLVRQFHRDGKIILAFSGCIVGKCDEYRVIFEDPQGNKKEYPGSPPCIEVENPQLWWPNGYGGQPLYRFDYIICSNGRELDRWSERIGLRKLTMHIEDDEYGRSFCHEVNGVKVFAMGADYIPEDNLLGRVTPERTRALLEQCVAANFNSIRVWGGGYYPDEWFYDACDELGLLVWQDFMFACAMYNLTEDFEENITWEITDNLKRIANRASLAILCGNNEMEMFAKDGIWGTTDRQRADYIKMYEYIFPKLCKQHCPDTFYWPASPSSGGSFHKPNDENMGDVHYWDVWHGEKPFSEYRKFFFRYASEFGFQSFPAMKTIESFTLPEDRNAFSYVMEKHQRNASANGRILSYLSQTYLYPGSLEGLVYASQLLQAEAMRYAVEHWRRNRGRCMGAIYWQLNDCWPVVSWSSIDYYGRWKALHYYARRFFAPIMLSCHEEGVLTQNTNVNAECTDLEKSIWLNLANETMSPVKALIRWALRDNTGKALREWEQETEVPALESFWLPKQELPEADVYSQYVSFEAVVDGQCVSSGTVLFGLPKHFSFLDPELSCTVSGDTITVKASAYAKSVEILNDNEDIILSDNYFDLSAGEKTVKIISGSPDNLRLRSVFDIK